MYNYFVTFAFFFNLTSYPGHFFVSYIYFD